QRPRADVDLEHRQACEEDPVRSVAADRIGPKARPSGAWAGLVDAGSVTRGQSRAEQRGEEPRIEGARGRNEVAHHEAHRLTDRWPSRKSPSGVVERPRNLEKALDEEADGILRAGPSSDAPVVARERRRIAVEMAIDRNDRHLCRAEGTMQSLAGERIEEPCGIADEEPIRAGPPRHPG